MSAARLATGLGAALLIGAAAASGPAHTTPSRDVEVVYDINDHGRHVQQHCLWQAATALERVQTEGDRVWLVEDGRNYTAAAVNDAARTVTHAAIRPGPLNGGGGTFSRLGGMTVAGVACTEWAVEGTGGVERNATAGQQVCLTDDGVPLSIRSGMTQIVRAVHVAYHRIDPAMFAIPVAYDQIQG